MSPFWPQGCPIEVEQNGDAPRRFSWQYTLHQVTGTSNHWRVHTDWWSDREVWRDYWEVTTKTNLLCIIYRDLLGGGWFLERIYE